MIAQINTILCNIMIVIGISFLVSAWIMLCIVVIALVAGFIKDKNADNIFSCKTLKIIKFISKISAVLFVIELLLALPFLATAIVIKQ